VTQFNSGDHGKVNEHSHAGEGAGSFQRAATLLGDLNTWDERAVDEMDYERRLRGYQALSSQQWQALGRRKVGGRMGVCT
jgi:hypothetical protein